MISKNDRIVFARHILGAYCPDRLGEAAKVAGVTKRTVYGWLSGDHLIPTEKALLIGRMTGVSVTSNGKELRLSSFIDSEGVFYWTTKNFT